MTFAHMSGLALAAFFTVATYDPRQPPAAVRTTAVVIEIARPAKTGLAPGRYRVEATASAGRSRGSGVTTMPSPCSARRWRTIR
jgi:hypothetical protein